MSPGEDVAHECGYYHEEEENDPNVSSLFIKIGAVVKSPANVEVDADEKEGGSIGVHVADYSAKVDVSADMCHG